VGNLLGFSVGDSLDLALGSGCSNSPKKELMITFGIVNLSLTTLIASRSTAVSHAVAWVGEPEGTSVVARFSVTLCNIKKITIIKNMIGDIFRDKDDQRKVVEN